MCHPHPRSPGRVGGAALEVVVVHSVAVGGDTLGEKHGRADAGLVAGSCLHLMGKEWNQRVKCNYVKIICMLVYFIGMKFRWISY